MLEALPVSILPGPTTYFVLNLLIEIVMLQFDFTLMKATGI